MTERVLPVPVTQQDEYLYAIALELCSLNAQLAQLTVAFTPSSMAEQTDIVELREPAPTPRKPRTREAARKAS